MVFASRLLGDSMLSHRLRWALYCTNSRNLLTRKYSTVTLNWERKQRRVQLRAKDFAAQFHYVWLRDHCPCTQCIDPSSKQKLHSSGDVCLSIEPLQVNLDQDHLHITWSDSHSSRFSLDWLRKNNYSRYSREFRAKSLKPILWKGSDFADDAHSLPKQLTVDYADFITPTNTYGFHTVLRALHDYGLAFLRRAPEHPQSDSATLERIAARLGHIRETFYGRTWTVESIPNAANIAYTSVELELHQDLCYFHCPPGLQILHCLHHDVPTGGDSTFLDSYTAVELLRQRAPHHFDVLTKVPVTYHYDNDGHCLKYHHPVIELDGQLNEYIKVTYSPPFQGTLSEIPEELVEPFYAAFQTLTKIIKEEKSLLLQRRLTPGDVVLFHNRRVLHGRTGFDPTTGRRKLKGLYIDWDDVMDRYRMMCKTKETQQA